MMTKKIGGILLGLAVCLGGTAYAVTQSTTQKEQSQERQQRELLQRQAIQQQQDQPQLEFAQQDQPQLEFAQQDQPQLEFAQQDQPQLEFAQQDQPQLEFAQQGQRGEQGGQSYQGQVAVAAPVPQYWLADAALFTSIAGDTAQTLRSESMLYIQEPRILASQSQFLVNAISRSLSSLRALEANAQSANPTALPAIRAAIGNLQAAQALAGIVASAAPAGVIGPSFDINTQAVSQHLRNVERELSTVAGQYGVQRLVARRGTQRRA